MGKTKEIRAYLSPQKKPDVLPYVKEFKSTAKALKEFKIPRSAYYKWNNSSDKDGSPGLLRKHPVDYNHPNKIKEEIVTDCSCM